MGIFLSWCLDLEKELVPALRLGRHLKMPGLLQRAQDPAESFSTCKKAHEALLLQEAGASGAFLALLKNGFPSKTSERPAELPLAEPWS